MRLDGIGALVAGGASGLGEASARELASRGARVTIADVNEERGEALAGEIGGAFAKADVTDEAQVQAAVEAAGDLRLAVSCAGIGWAERTVKKDGPHSLESFRKSIDLNLIGTLNISRLAAWHMSKNDPVDDDAEERGVIINTASIAAFEGQIGQLAYTASKAAIAGMCLTMARDLGSLGIRALAIAPSLFATGLTEGIPDEYAAVLTKDAAFPKRLGRPEEYAKLALAIVDNPMLNGQCLRLDAGQRFAPK